MENQENSSNESFSAEEVKAGKELAILAYLAVLAVIPWFVARDNKFVMAHVSQGVTLFILWLGLAIVDLIFLAIPVINILATLIHVCLFIIFAGFAIWGIVQCINGTFTPMPFISTIAKKLNIH